MLYYYILKFICTNNNEIIDSRKIDLIEEFIRIRMYSVYIYIEIHLNLFRRSFTNLGNRTIPFLASSLKQQLTSSMNY